jgi:CheY-like chemotaxis protein
MVAFILGIYFFRKHTIISVNLKNVLWMEHMEKQKYEELTKLKEQFLADVSHELRTPLTLILGPLKKMIRDSKHSGGLHAIYRNAARLKMLVDQIMDFGKIESGMLRINKSRINVAELTRSIVANFVDYAKQKNISLVLNTRLVKCVVDLDEDKYDKIVTNLLSNAIKSISGKGTITITLDYDTDSAILTLIFKDTGKGIVESDLNRIFDRYYTSPDQTQNTQSTGIGLYLTKKLIELQYGTIRVSSKVNAGTTFTIKLPFDVFELETNNGRSIITHRNFNSEKETDDKMLQQFPCDKTILVIDDNPDMCNFVETILKNDFNVIKVNNASDGMKQIATHLPDLIISDVMMPEMDGFELCRRIKNDVRFSHIPVILLTAKATKKDHITGYKTGADDYIYKPFEEVILKARVINLINQKEKLRKHFIGSDGILNPKVEATDLDVAFVDEILLIIKECYSDPDFHVNAIIERMGMSRSIFYSKFKALSDQSINDLIKNYRLKKAEELLKRDQYTISQVAYDCGFSDPAYFSRVFKEYYKITPKVYSDKKTDIEMPSARDRD